MEMTLMERDLLDLRIQQGTRKIAKFLGDMAKPFKDRLIVYLGTPSVCRNSVGAIPSFPLFEKEYGEINWQKDFSYLRRDQTVNLVLMIDFLTKGVTTYFPKHWTDDMFYLFVKDCVDNSIHEFDYYW